MKRIFGKRSIVRLNFLLSLGFGILMGIIFPLYAGLFVIFKNDLLKILFCAGCIIAGICVGLTAFLITRFTILRIVRIVSGELKEIASGTGNLKERIRFNSQDEIGELVQWFNMVMTGFEEMIKSTKQNINITKETSRELSAKWDAVSASIKTISAEIRKINGIQATQNTMVDSTEVSFSILNDSMLIIISNIMEFFEQMDSLTTAIINQSHSIEEIIANISLVSEKIGNNEKSGERKESSHSLQFTGTGFIEKTVHFMTRSRSNIFRIREILGNIDDIAVNTNLLAINTSIEAAHAGSAGKGFQIIANEIRKLADSTNQLTHVIQEVIDTIDDDTRKADMDIKTNQQQYNTTLTDITSATGSLFDTARGIKTITLNVKSNYSAIGQLLVLLKEKMEGLKANSEICHTSMINLKQITGTIQEQLAVITGESENINTHNTAAREQFLHFENSLADVEKHVSHFAGRCE